MQIRTLIVVVAIVGALSTMALPLPEGLSEGGRRTLIVGIVMAALWMTEALPLFVTALFPLIAFPLAGIAALGVVSQAYAHPLVMLFMGGFMLAAAMQRWQLHRRVAVMALRLAGARPDMQILAIMIVTAFLSMWISNTATTMVMMPIGLAILSLDRQGEAAGGVSDEAGAMDVEPPGSGEPSGAATALMLGIAYAATIGGMGSLIGTPPNALFAGFVEKTYGVSIGFAQWMLLGVPIVVVLLPLTWLLLTRVSFKMDTRGAPVSVQLEELPPLSAGQRIVATILVIVALGWIVRPLLSDWLDWPGLTDAGIALAGVVALFAVPRSLANGTPVLTWEDVKTIRWDVLILFGGGLALADAIQATGLAGWIAGGATELANIPTAALILVMMVIIVYLGELASNTAMAAIFLPIAAASAVALNTEPLTLLVPVALAASLGFMLPVATPPNAIVYGSGAVKSSDMLTAGAILDVLSIAVVFVLSMVLFPIVFGVSG
jgi:sodium-dependent dicarboxylate transporter 2/3/5